MLAAGMKAEMHYYAIYCEGDYSLHFLVSETQLLEGNTLKSNGETITKVYRVERTLTNSFPSWNNNSEDSNNIASATTTVVFEESFKDVQPASCHFWFSGFSKLTNIEGLTNLNTSQVTEFSNMFENCSSLTSLNLSSFDTANVTTLYHMFMGCSRLESLDLSNFNTANVTTMAGMFSGCKNLTSLNLSGFNTANVTSMNSMFLGCENLTSLDLVSFDTSNVTDMTNMFRGCENLAAIYVSNNFITEKVTESNFMFEDCYHLRNFDYYDDVSKANYGPEGYLTYALPLGVPCAVYFKENKPLLFIVPDETSRFKYDGTTVSQVWKIGDGSNPVWKDTDAKDRTAVTFDESFASWRPSDCASWFSGFSNLTTITGLDYLNTENVTSLSEMFSGCSSLTSLDLSNFNTVNVTDMGAMFSGCSGLTSLDLGTFNTVNVAVMASMFSGCNNLASLNLNGFDTENVTDMQSMFSGCSGLTNLDLSSFTTAKVTDMIGMFRDCAGLTDLDLSSFDTANVIDMSNLFSGCSGLISLDINKFNTDKVTSVSSMFDQCNGLRIVDMSQGSVPNFSDFASQIAESSLVFLPEGTAVTEGRANVVVGDQCGSLVLNNGELNRQLLLKVPYAFTAQRVTINRSFTKDQPYTLYLPFEMKAADYGTFYTGGEYDAEEGMVRFSKVTEEKTTANTPYMFLPNQEFTTGITIEGPVAVAVTPEDEEVDGLNGVYEMREFTADEEAQKIYYGWANGEFCWAKAGATVDACRVYFKLPASATAKAPARLMVKFGEDGTTGITDIDRENGDTNSPIYNINGQRVGSGYRGLVIKNGKKTVNFAR